MNTKNNLEKCKMQNKIRSSVGRITILPTLERNYKKLPKERG